MSKADSDLMHVSVNDLSPEAAVARIIEHCTDLQISDVFFTTNENHLAVASGPDLASVSFEVEKDFRPLSFTSNGEFEGEVVFAGYGLKVPGKAGEGCDSYAALDVTNKIVLVLRYVPEDAQPHRRQELNRYAALRGSTAQRRCCL